MSIILRNYITRCEKLTIKKAKRTLEQSPIGPKMLTNGLRFMYCIIY